MRRIRRMAGAAVALVLVASPVVAQGAGQDSVPGRMGRGMLRGGPAAMERNPAAAVLEHREALELTAEQVSRLEAIRDHVAQENSPRWEQLRAAFGDANPRDMTPEERQAHRAQMQALAPVRDEIRATNRAAGEEIHELLTDDQEATLRPLMRRGHRGPQPPRAGRGGRGPRGGGGG
jgi:hypothetical protein